MKIIVGLGNPGDRYRETRHNIGFHVLEELACRWHSSPWKHRFEAEVSEHRAVGPVLLVKPQTFMNLSGVAVRETVKFFKAASTDVIVVHDDLDLPAGRLRIRERGGSGGHRGIGSILTELGTEEFIRVRFGVGRPPEGWDSADYVLGKFPKEEHELIRAAVLKAADAIEAILQEGAVPAMNRFNRLD